MSCQAWTTSNGWLYLELEPDGLDEAGSASMAKRNAASARRCDREALKELALSLVKARQHQA